MPFLERDPNDPWKRYADRKPLGEHRFGRRVQIQANAAGTEIVGNGRYATMFDTDPEDVPRIPREYRWGGICEFLPQPWADEQKDRIGGLFPVQALCLSCNRHRSPKPMRGIYALAWASDHEAEFVGHALILLYQGRIVARNPYHPLLGTQISGAEHRAFIEKRKRALYQWQRVRTVKTGYADKERRA